MRRKLTAMYAITLFLLLLGGMIAVLLFAYKDTDRLIKTFVGCAVSFVLAPVCHEFGHAAFARLSKMKIVYLKCFCFRYAKVKGKGKFSLCSPFEADETQALPTTAEGMQNRALLYSAGGLITEGAVCLVLGVCAILTAVLGVPNFLLFGILPYAVYLFLLNAAPLEYPSGKTDMRIIRGIKKGEPAERTMVAVMAAQGELYTGKSFGELQADTLFSLPQLAEDEPLFAAVLDMKYRYALEKQDYDLAEDCLKRLLASEEYLTDGYYQTLKIELVYFSLLLGKDEPLKKLYETDEEFLRSDDYRAKRILALYSSLVGKAEEAEILIAQAQDALEGELTSGVRKFEEILLGRIKERVKGNN